MTKHAITQPTAPILGDAHSCDCGVRLASRMAAAAPAKSNSGNRYRPSAVPRWLTGKASVRIATASRRPNSFGIRSALRMNAEKTVLIYWMYDTMPITQPDAWTSPPFEARLVEQAPYKKVLIGRGATNSKGPQMAQLNAFRAIKAVHGKLPVNLSGGMRKRAGIARAKSAA
mgnify:CR=1 FL=1